MGGHVKVCFKVSKAAWRSVVHLKEAGFSIRPCKLGNGSKVLDEVAIVVH